MVAASAQGWRAGGKVETGLPHLPCIEVQRGELAEVGVRHVHIERLRLVDERPAVGGHVHQGALLDLPHRLVQRLQALRDVQRLRHPPHASACVWLPQQGTGASSQQRSCGTATNRKHRTCTLPLAATSSFLVSASQRPVAVRSDSRCWFTTVNSPESTRRT